MLNRILFLAFLLLPNWAAAFSLPVEETLLKNGLTVLTHVNRELPTVSLQVFVDAGSRDEVIPGKSGLAHIFEHLMFRGTDKHPKYEEALKLVGASNNADTTRDRTRYFENVRPKYLQYVIDVEADRFRYLNFTRAAFNKELGPVRQEREVGVDNNPGGFLYEKLHNLAFRRHTYQHSVIGFKRDILNMQYEDAFHFYESFYQPQKIVIVVAGNFDRKAALGWIGKAFGGDWGRKVHPAYKKKPRKEPKQNRARSKQYTWKDALTPPLMQMGYHIPAFTITSKEFCSLELVENLLFLESSPLRKRLIEELELVQPGGFGGGAGRSKDPGLFYFFTTLRQGRDQKAVRRVQQEIDRELKRLATTPVSQARLKMAVNNHVAATLYYLNKAGRIAGQIGGLYLLTQNPNATEEVVNCYNKVTPKDMQMLVARYLKPENRTTVVLMPKRKS